MECFQSDISFLCGTAVQLRLMLLPSQNLFIEHSVSAVLYLYAWYLMSMDMDQCGKIMKILKCFNLMAFLNQVR